MMAPSPEIVVKNSAITMRTTARPTFAGEGHSHRRRLPRAVVVQYVQHLAHSPVELQS